jgi:outer membrane protein OmpA-like peptidoglycan-associated protein/Mg-chelatase subunit ChlD
MIKKNLPQVFKLLITFLFCIILFSCNKPAIDAIFTTKAKRIQQGDSIVLKWEVFPNPEISSISLDDLQENIPMVGEILVYPEQSKTYYLKVKNRDGKEKRFTTRLNIIPPDFEEINYPKKVYDEDPILINWIASNSKFVTIKGIPDSLPTEGFYSIFLDSTQKFTIRAHNKNGYVTEKNIWVNLRQPDQIYGDSVLCYGDQITLSWNFKNSTKIRISGNDQDFKPIDQIILKPEKSRYYKFIAYRDNGKTDSRNFKVFVLPEGMVKFTCPEKVERGGEIDLSWEVKEIDSLLFSNGKRVYKKLSNGSIRQKVTDNVKFELIFKYKDVVYRYPKYIQVVERKFIEGKRSVTELSSKNKLNFEIFSIDKSKYPDEIKLYVLVVDTSGYFITNLATSNDRKNSFRKYFKQLVETVADKKYPINNFDVKEIYNLNSNSDFSVVLDYSGSMYSDIGYLEKSMDKFIKLVNEKDRISIVKFDDQLNNILSLTDNKAEIYNKYAFKGLTDMGGETALYAGTDLGFRQFDSIDSRFKRVILFTDGNENASYPYYMDYAVTANAVIAKSRKDNIPMFIVSYGSGTNINLLDEMASLSGGKHYNIRNHKNIEKVFGEFIKTTKYFYEITYKPTIADRERTIELIYNDLNKTQTTTSKLYIGEDYDVMPLELDGTAGFVSLADSLKKISKLKQTSNPQVITLFDFDKSVILPKYKDVILNYVNILKSKPGCEAVLIGHTDRVGNEGYCYILSLRRAEEIKEAIVKQGINPERIKTLGFGKMQPVWNPEKNESQARENRRVEIVILE